MANPQLENGYLKLANELVDQFAKLHLSGNEWCILWVVLRKTYGFNKKEDMISFTQFQKLTGLSRPSVAEAIKKLVVKQVLVPKKVLFINQYSLNKIHSKWTSSEKGTSRVFPTRVVPKKVLKLVPKKVHTKDNKDNITKDILLRNKEFGNPNINELIKYFLLKMSLPEEDCSIKQSRQYWNLLLKKSKKGIEGVKWLIDLASEDEFYKNNITSSKTLYYNRIKLISRKRGNKPKFAIMPTGGDKSG